MKKLTDILRYTVFSLILLIMAALAAIQTSYIQNLIKDKAVSILEDNIDASVSVGSFKLKSMNSLLLEDVAIVDSHPFEGARDTVLSAKSIGVQFSLRGLIGPGHKDIILKKVSVDRGQFNLVIENNSEFSTNVVRVINAKRPDRKKRGLDRDILQIRRISLENFRFTMKNFSKPKEQARPYAINWSDFVVDSINVDASDFRISHKKFYGRMNHMDFRESTGWNVRELTGETVSGDGLACLNNMHLEDEESVLDFEYTMTGRTPQFRDYINQVVMDVKVHNGQLSLKTLAHFIPPLNPDPSTMLSINGHARGTVADLESDGIKIKAIGKCFETNFSGKVKGLPDVRKMWMDAKLGNTVFTVRSLCALVNAVAPKARLDLKKFGKGAIYRTNISATGYLNDLEEKISLSQGGNGGNVTICSVSRNIMPGRTEAIAVSGKVEAKEFDLGKFLGTEKVGGISVSSLVSVSLPFGKAPIDARLDSLEIDKFGFNGYDYGNITGSLAMQGKDLTVDIQSKDDALDADVTIWTDKYAYSGAALIRKADLNRMNIDKRGRSDVAFNLYGHLDKDLNKIQGNANISGIFLANDDVSERIEDITVDVENVNDVYKITLNSDIASGFFTGNKNHMEANFNAYETSQLFSFLLPGLYLEKGTSADFKMDEAGYMEGSVNSGRLAYGDSYIKDIEATVTGSLKDMTANITASKLSAKGVELNCNVIHADKKDNVINLEYDFNNSGLDAARKFGMSDLNAEITLRDRHSFKIDILPSLVNADGRNWDISRSIIDIQGRNITVDDFCAQSGDRWLKVDGKISEDNEETLSADIHDLDLKMLNEFTKLDIGFRGRINAKAEIFSPLLRGIEIKLDGKDIAMNGQEMGDISAVSHFDDSDKMFHISADEILDSCTVMTLNATYNPADKHLAANAAMDRFPVGFMSYLFPSVFSRTGGTLSGNVSAEGPLKKLDWSSSNGHINDGLLKVRYTHVPYYLNGDFTVDNSGIHIINADIRDRYAGTGKMNGAITWERCRNFGLDLKMNVANMELLDIPASDKIFMNGKVFGTGTVSLHGPMHAMTLTADAYTVGKSKLNLVMSDSENATKGNLLTFKDKFGKDEDPYSEILKKYSSGIDKGLYNFMMKLHVRATPDAEMFLNLGNRGFAASVSGRGNGVIDMDIATNPSKFSIIGDYTLAEGIFNVNASNIVSRSFSITDGSSIKFPGDIMESTVDLKAIYQTNASIETLLAEKEAVANRRQVNCEIHMQNKLMNPDMDFHIDIPDLSPAAKSQVESALSTDDKVQRQLLSLLISNNFLPDEQSGIVNNSSLIYSNVSEIMANQVNNIFNKLNIPLDLGLNYRPAENGTANLFDVALSTQLFNNRVIIGGTLGNKQNLNSNNESLFGNLDIQYKVIKSGALRVNLFSHAADQYTNALDDSQKNGIGVTWQQEFDKFREWCRNLFAPKAEKEAIATREAEEARKTQTHILNGE